MSGTLLAHHEALLRASGIGEDVACEREYESVTKPIDLGRRGFREAQRSVPALLIPVWDVTGQIGLYQSRPDTPRIGDNGKQVKYETPGKARMCLDVPKRIRPYLGDPTTPLYLTEGVRKADSAVTRGLCCLALLGVFNWRGTNDDGGKVALPDWEAVALNGRPTYIAFDSDVMVKGTVYRALARLKAFLEQRGARVWLIYLPPAADGAKVGLDDFFAAGHTRDDLLALATETLRPVPDGEDEPAGPYRETPGGLVWQRPTQAGPIDTPLTNFLARIVGDVAEDDGIEARRTLEVAAQLGERRRSFRLPAERFAAMGWPIEHLGAGAIVFPGMGTKDHARAAIQLLSGAVAERTVRTHTGWVRHGEEWVYLTGTGAIGAAGLVPGVDVALPGDLGRYALPDPPAGEALALAVRASLRAIGAAPERVTVPLLAGVYRAPFGDCDFSEWLVGPTGTGKSEIAALMQQHWGAGFDSRHLPGAWSSTGNALEGLASLVKDALLVIDDFAPGGNQSDVQRMHRDAERILRAQGNMAGRQRMNANTTLRAPRPPRGLVLGTGEDVPRGQSAQARALVLEVSPGEIDWARITACQADAAAGLYAAAMAGYVRWLTPRFEEARRRLRAEMVRLRAMATGSAAHRRTPEIVAALGAGWRAFLSYALDAGAITPVEAQTAWARGWAALGAAAAAQGTHQAASEPAARFLALLGSALASGRAHVAGTDGEEPPDPARWGWREVTMGGEYPRQEWRPQGARVGWVDGEALYLDRDAAMAEAQRLGRDVGDGLAVTGSTLAKRLHERGLLAGTDEKRQTLTIRRTVEGRVQGVLHLHAATLSPTEKPDKPDNATDWSGFAAPLSGFGGTPDQQPDNENRGSGYANGTIVGFVGFFEGRDAGCVETAV